jgi:hypothetical protein
MMGFWFCHREERIDVAISFITFIDSLGDDAYIVPFSWKTYQSS